jgi:type VI secretion system protein ImpI/type VI secretion system protein
VLAAAGAMLRLLVDGVAAQLARRARDKAELGADRTAFAPGAVNPLKALPADRALAAMLDPDARGTMAADRAVADAMADLDAHADATLKAMQGALAATLDRFSPAAIRGRATAGGLMTRVLPAAKEAALWQAYEREFDGVRRGSSDAFVELFASAFAAAYRDASSGPRPPS